MAMLSSEDVKDISVEAVRENPGLLLDLLLKDQDISVVFEKRGDRIRYAYLKAYDPESLRILREAKQMHRRIKARGYDRDQAFRNLGEARDEIERKLS